MKKCIIAILSSLGGAAVGVLAAKNSEKKKIKEILAMSDKHLTLFLMMERWIQVKQRGKSLVEYMKRNNYKTIAIYGMSYAGRRLLDEFENSNIIVKYAIDKRAGELCERVAIVSPNGKLDPVDAVIVTSIYFIDEIREELCPKICCPILSLGNILEDALEDSLYES